ncbi:3-oxoacyl-[acyl-carrier-protein] reductase [Peptoniphilus asaccharolyticus DSM 20463]|uniref:3-oxoacyl-[acyl-carrier-protein] reductase n=1 Tax=Peptoniphilus asaccharolyticus DSM 20463 TaxID=573058 RepID=A0A1W1UXG4_PEPAS|nr:3-oxoacyl-[acyl-carrier-protein] reductase [Peptoniphilus asaccharolyticus]MBL7575305.1 3-oxoacyl-[acyl-carrier-protein] reductase [Peptoniphilus asaccharolyticus]SMB85700.1 3-oxoacyl-[acyl-carrier-protein] reductase [Peptoniphilus asaccharolyticus DSM 20463]
MEDKKIALVTGATGGIGSAIARDLKAQGYSLIIHGNSNLEKLENLKYELGEDVYTVVGDLSKFEVCEKIAKECLEIAGHLDVLVNNAGITKDNLILRMTDEDFIKVVETNLNSAFYLTKLFCKSMIKNKYGRIINITSISGVHGNAGQANYSSAKAAMIGLTKATAKELASKNILVNAIAPGFIETKMTDKLGDSTKEKILTEIPLRRIGQPEEIAKVVSFLASESASYITGQVINVDGGMGI